VEIRQSRFDAVNEAIQHFTGVAAEYLLFFSSVGLFAVTLYTSTGVKPSPWFWASVALVTVLSRRGERRPSLWAGSMLLMGAALSLKPPF
jgi:hypothetical protein